MNPNRHRAVEIRRRAITDQIEGLEREVAAGRAETHHADRLEHTRAELAQLEIHPVPQNSAFRAAPIA